MAEETFGIPQSIIDRALAECGFTKSADHFALACFAYAAGLKTSVRVIDKLKKVTASATPLSDGECVYKISNVWEVTKGIYIPVGFSGVVYINDVPAGPAMKCDCAPEEESSPFVYTNDDMWGKYTPSRHIIYNSLELCRREVHISMRFLYLSNTHVVLTRDDAGDETPAPQDLLADVMYQSHITGETIYTPLSAPSQPIYIGGKCTGFTQGGLFAPVATE